MILIFDTNSVRMLPHEGGNADLLRIIKTSGKARVAIPEMVLQEMIAQQVIEYREAYATAESHVRKLYGRHPGPHRPFRKLPPTPAMDKIGSTWEKYYREIFEIIPTTGKVAYAALIREANGEKPAKIGGRPNEKKKSGARDVAIWLSIIQFMKCHPQEEVCFVTNNSKDFGNGAAWPHPMDRDLTGMEGRISLIENMDAVIAKFTEEMPDQDLGRGAREALEALAPAMGEHAQRKMRGVAIRGSLLSSISDRTGLPRPTNWRNWLTPPLVTFLHASNVTGHKIGERIWFTATVEWLVWGHARSWKPSRDIIPVACVWRTRMLMDTSGSEEPTVLSGPLITENLSDTNRAEWEHEFFEISSSLSVYLPEDDEDDEIANS